MYSDTWAFNIVSCVWDETYSDVNLKGGLKHHIMQSVAGSLRNIKKLQKRGYNKA